MAESKSKPKTTSDSSDLSALEGQVIDEEREITRPAATHDDILAAVEEERRDHDVEHLVQTRAGDRPISQGFPPPPTSSYLVLPEGLWPEGISYEDHVGHAWQVRQVRTYGAGGLPTVNLVCDCGAEMTFLWDEAHAEAAVKVDEADLERLREVPEEFAHPAPRGDLLDDNKVT